MTSKKPTLLQTTDPRDINLSLIELYQALENELRSLGYSYQNPNTLAKSILKVSEHFILKKGPSDWKQKDFQAAYIAHFLPMNILRWLKVFERAEDNFKLAHSKYYDFGAGPMTFLIAYMLKFKKFPIQYLPYELNEIPLNLGKSILGNLFPAFNKNIKSITNHTQQPDTDHTLILSYSLNELDPVPSYFLKFESLLILEPSTQKDSRQLLYFRKKALEDNYSVLAPCTHMEECPLLKESKKDWCFDRTHIELPESTQKLYKSLPFETHHLTFSYLLLQKRLKDKSSHQEHSFRVTGDWQKEKGKSKIMICRSSNKEFISLLDRVKKEIVLSRGDLKQLDFKFDQKGHELRLID